MATNKLIFATYAGSSKQLQYVYRLAESIRTFGGQFSASPIWVYIPRDVKISDKQMLSKLHSLDIQIRKSHTPKDAEWFYYAGKVYAAAEAEAAADGETSTFVWLDEDTILLSEPIDFDLASGICLAYCPVMHNRSGSLYGAPPDDFWRRIYEKLAVNDDSLFPMITPADKQKIRAYFHVGLLVVRPEKGILRQWLRHFETLYKDPILSDMCKTDVNKRIFLHQTAMVGILNKLRRHEMVELSDRYNCPIFFEKRYDSQVAFNSIENAITIRCVVPLKDMGHNWPDKLAGPADKISWLQQHLND